jgi:hypothetical protein
MNTQQPLYLSKKNEKDIRLQWKCLNTIRVKKLDRHDEKCRNDKLIDYDNLIPYMQPAWNLCINLQLLILGYFGVGSQI